MEKDKGKNTGHIGYLWGGEVGERADMNEREVSEIKDVEPCKYFLFKTKECYIGQAVDLASRWKDHAKCGLHIDSPAGN